MKKIIVFIVLTLSLVLCSVAQEKVIQVFKNGEVVEQYSLDEVDYIEINDVIPVPSDLKAVLGNGVITITWQAVEGATYNVYRSMDDDIYVLLAENLTESMYIDDNPIDGTNYYKVKAMVGGVCSDYSDVVSVSTLKLSTEPIDLSLAVVIDGTRYYVKAEEYEKLSTLPDCIVEGVTIISSTESFIIAMEDASSDCMRQSVAKAIYGDMLPSKEQGVVISARWSDINNAIIGFGGKKLIGSTGTYTGTFYWTSAADGTYEYYIKGSGGEIGRTSDWADEFNVRQVKSTLSEVTSVWRDEDDLKLSVVINGSRRLISKEEYASEDFTGYEKEGVVVKCGTEYFILALQNASTDPMTAYAANEVYTDKLPTYEQGMVIGARISDINEALGSFGGEPFLLSRYPMVEYWYWTKDMSITGYYYYIERGDGGYLKYDKENGQGYVRTVITME